MKIEEALKYVRGRQEKHLALDEQILINIDRDLAFSARAAFRQYLNKELQDQNIRIYTRRDPTNNNRMLPQGKRLYRQKFQPDERLYPANQRQGYGQNVVPLNPNYNSPAIRLAEQYDALQRERRADEKRLKELGKIADNNPNRELKGAEGKEYSQLMKKQEQGGYYQQKYAQLPPLPQPLPPPNFMPKQDFTPQEEAAFKKKGKLADITLQPSENAPASPEVAPNPKWSVPTSKADYANPFFLNDPDRIKNDEEMKIRNTPYNTYVTGSKKAGNLSMRYVPTEPEDSPETVYKRNLPGLPNYNPAMGADYADPYEGTRLEGIANTARNIFDTGKGYADTAGRIMSGVGNRVGGIGKSLMSGLTNLGTGIGAVQNVLGGVEGVMDSLHGIGNRVGRWFEGDTEATDAMGKEAEDRVRNFENSERYLNDQIQAADAQQTGMENAYGKVAWVGDSKDGTRRMISKLDKYQQQKKDLAGEYAAMLAEKGKTLSDDAEGGIRDNVRESLLKNFESANGQRFKDEQRALETKLLNQGMSPDSPGYRKQMAMLLKEQESARNDAVNNANLQSYQVGSQAFNDRLAAFGQQGNLFQMYDDFKDPTDKYQSGAQHGGNVFTGTNLKDAQGLGLQQQQMAEQQRQFDQEQIARQQQQSWQSQENALEREQRTQDLENERLWKTKEGKLERELKAAGLTSQERMMVAKLKAEAEMKTGEQLHQNTWRQWLPKLLQGGGSILSGIGSAAQGVGSAFANFSMGAANSILKKVSASNLAADTAAKLGKEQRDQAAFHYAEQDLLEKKGATKYVPEDNDPLIMNEDPTKTLEAVIANQAKGKKIYTQPANPFQLHKQILKDAT